MKFQIKEHEYMGRTIGAKGYTKLSDVTFHVENEVKAVDRMNRLKKNVREVVTSPKKVIDFVRRVISKII